MRLFTTTLNSERTWYARELFLRKLVKSFLSPLICVMVASSVSEEYEIYRIRMPRYDNELIVEYVRNTDDEYQRVDEPKRIIDNDMEFSKIEEECSEKNLYDLYFATLEECQRHCDYLNEKNGSAGYDYALDGTYIGNDREEER